ncbi:hypothetical protein OIU74_013812 [Salix koriyanagi]|uniref:Uncharacterized protein n=1 Tax=Salix koriyanagi TaxID=2511006 RepID=A0A9Q0NHY0_9ROSI|nr:hypothetical protein OIU74_013812 [Salix koriyanagi]
MTLIALGPRARGPWAPRALGPGPWAPCHAGSHALAPRGQPRARARGRCEAPQASWQPPARGTGLGRAPGGCATPSASPRNASRMMPRARAREAGRAAWARRAPLAPRPHGTGLGAPGGWAKRRSGLGGLGTVRGATRRPRAVGRSRCGSRMSP